jgi:hypothetical protein
MELVAETINKVKKRKDIVEKYVKGRGSLNVMYFRFKLAMESAKNGTEALNY